MRSGGNAAIHCRDALSEDDVTRVIDPDNVTHRLCDTDAKNAHPICYGTRFPVMNGCPGCRNDSGSSKLHRKGGRSIELEPPVA
jgi:hypothetical protein